MSPGSRKELRFAIATNYLYSQPVLIAKLDFGHLPCGVMAVVSNANSHLVKCDRTPNGAKCDRTVSSLSQIEQQFDHPPHFSATGGFIVLVELFLQLFEAVFLFEDID